MVAVCTFANAAAAETTVYIDRDGNVVQQVFTVPQTFNGGTEQAAVVPQTRTQATGTASLQVIPNNTTGTAPTTVIVTDMTTNRCQHCDAWRYSGLYIGGFPWYWHPHLHGHPHFNKGGHKRRFGHR